MQDQNRILDTTPWRFDDLHAMRRSLLHHRTLGRDERQPIMDLLDIAQASRFDDYAFLVQVGVAMKTLPHTAVGRQDTPLVVAEILQHAMALHGLSEEDVPKLGFMFKAMRDEARRKAAANA